MKRPFKYYPQDFGALPVKVLHFDLFFDVFDDYTKVLSHMKLKNLQKPLSSITLDAKKLQIVSVSCKQTSCTYEYKEEENKLIINFAKKIPKNSEFIITTQTVCKPTKNDLEGLYYDETPKGAPPTQITQCQQWGFQKLVPCFDDMTAKCTYITTITANSRYTNIISNGDLFEGPTSLGNDRVKVIYHNTKTPMAPYLFFLGVGTYATFHREFEYPLGETFILELLVPPKTDPLIAKRALDVLHDAVLWIYLFTGKDKYQNNASAKKLWELIAEREQLKFEKKNVANIRSEIKKIANDHTWGYQYTGKVYREIGMQNSDFGGMENVGNTTITTNRIMPFPQMVDRAFEYMIDVKVHEYYHNLNGSEVTGKTPFEIWLNEAVTVHIERDFHSFLFEEEYSRLREVIGILMPTSGTLAQDQGTVAMPIEPNAFNDPNELISNVTYVKAPEFVRMIETLIGKEQFAKGLALYHQRYKHSNATREQWIKAMEEVSGLSFQKMAHTWLKEIGYPILSAKTNYDSKKKTYTLTLTQTNATSTKTWDFPLLYALCDKKGKVISQKLLRINKKTQKVTISNVEEPAYLSISCGYSFYGKIIPFQTEEQLFLKVKTDEDIVNRFIAFTQLLDKQKMQLLKSEKASVDSKITDLFYDLFSNTNLLEMAGGQFLTIFEAVEDEKFAYKYQVLYEVRKKIMRAVASKHEKKLMGLYEKYKSIEEGKTYLETKIRAIKKRQIKNVILSYLSTLDTPQIHRMIKEQFYHQTSASDKIISFELYLNSSAKDKYQLLEEYQKEAQQHLVSWEMFLTIVGRNDADNFLELIERVEQSPFFRIEQSNDQRALYVSFALNKKKSLLTQKGREYLRDTVIKLAPINEYTTGRILPIFGDLDKMDEEHHLPIVKIMVEILDNLDAKKTPSVYNTLKRILLNLKKSRLAYEKKYGKIK